ncbi:MAG: hypothetical protein A3C84_02015 [Candidatus Ryanbacteria bacterium RIFCSPHIGHO2_02_FULL_48_12]|uniref:Uncharacterized protein n=1 Tax=Candidatus Ryanbacteria bacterium RIFCSPHIGHO2_01_FULL_48_27 TaxID=1802115 RepID=A0A1G2G5S7_9BACT|nr:MAG: hypothetical protein A2756_01615 [Candidatus Ryanbacteria bacterium RIFCSPHIGHO2_01_FULL_48_27]OGZ50517.1 MAG: hypothetical protein A3C84_02015 [Candidatus Ryanbacteria bacterium RIFCSPHIGHO2_02_FULL_48_12]
MKLDFSIPKTRHFIKASVLVAVVFVIPTGWLAYHFICNPYGGIGGGAAHVYNVRSGDLDRARDKSSIQLALELYKEKNLHYPERLQELLENNYIDSKKITDPITNEVYVYVLWKDGEDYVIKIPFGTLPSTVDFDRHLMKARKSSMEKRLKNDLDGVVSGINCNDPIYCAGKDTYPR